MVTYTARYTFLDEGVHGEVVDFPGVITFGVDLAQARRLLAGALVDMAETNLSLGEPLPLPDREMSASESGADLVEPIYLIFEAASMVKVVPEVEYEAA
ncbi:MAG: type II toxin-antitoxin system HicB family antitoxin [Acidobacteria bacterium]|nr:type II toxin-antitoxin system HicB family antitoxin [Acidobacteriota bacterium]